MLRRMPSAAQADVPEQGEDEAGQARRERERVAM